MADLIKRDDALVACDIAPADEWNEYTKDGYIFAAEECKRNIAALPAVTVAEPVAHAYIVDGECEQIEWGAEYCLPDDPALTILYTLTPTLPAVTVGVKPLRYFEPEGSTVEQMRDHARQHPLAKEGDMKLVWINEGDLSMYLLTAMQSAPVADSQPAINPAAIREAALTAKLDKAVEALRETTQMLSQCTFTIIRMKGQYFERHEVVDKAHAVLAELEKTS